MPIHPSLKRTKETQFKVIVSRIEECLKSASQQTLERVLSLLEGGRAKGHGSANAEADGDGTRATLVQFRRRRTRPWNGDKLLDYHRRDRKEEETAVEFLNALRKLALEAGFIDCNECHNREMMLLGSLISGGSDEAIRDQIMGLDALPSAEEMERICGRMEERRATAMPPLKRKKQWAAAAAASRPRDEGIGTAAKRLCETAGTPAGQSAGAKAVAACTLALVIHGETLVSKVRRQRGSFSEARACSPHPLPSPPPLTSATSPADRLGSPAPTQSKDNLALKVSPPHGAIEFGADGCESPPPPPARRRPVYVRPIVPRVDEPSTSSVTNSRDLPGTSNIARPDAPAAAAKSTPVAATTSNSATPAQYAQSLTDVVPAKRGGGKGMKLKELLPKGWSLTVEQTANMDMQRLEQLMASMQLSAEDVEKVKQVRRLEKNRRAAKKSRNNTVQAMEKLR